MEQLSLWSEVEEKQEEVTPTETDYGKVPPIGGIIERPSRWADGDTRPESLQRLANLLFQPGTNTNTIHTTEGTVIWFRIIKTCVEGDHVIVTMERIEPLVKGYVDWLREQALPVTDDE